MPVPVENVQEGKCYRLKDDIPRRVLRIHEGQVTYIKRGERAWDVLRSYEPIGSFAKKCEAEVDYTTLEDIDSQG